MSGNSNDRGDIIIGVDGSPCAARAVQWAVAEARLRRARLRFIHCVPTAVSGAGGEPDPVLEQATSTALRAETGSAVDARTVAGGVIPTLVELSDSAGLVVLGSGGSAGADHVGRATSMGVTMQARCPVVVVPGAAVDQLPRVGPVVVGVNGSSADPAALQTAFTQASLRATELVVIWAWGAFGAGAQLRSNLAPPESRDEWLATSDDYRRRLEDRISRWVARYPQVPVRRFAVYGSAVCALMTASQDAQLLVIGNHGHAAGQGSPVMSTRWSMIHRSACPVLICERDGGSEIEFDRWRHHRGATPRSMVLVGSGR